MNYNVSNPCAIFRETKEGRDKLEKFTQNRLPRSFKEREANAYDIINLQVSNPHLLEEFEKKQMSPLIKHFKKGAVSTKLLHCVIVTNFFSRMNIRL